MGNEDHIDGCVILSSTSDTGLVRSNGSDCKKEATRVFHSCLRASVGMTTAQEVKAECQNGGETANSCYPKLLSTLAPCSDSQQMNSANILVSATKAANMAFLCKDPAKYMKVVITDATCWAAINDCVHVFITETSFTYGRSHCKNLRETIDGCKVTIRRLVNCTENVYPIVNRYFKHFLAYTPCGYERSLHDTANSLTSQWSAWTVWLPFLLRIF